MSEAILRLATAGSDELQRVLGNVRSAYRNVAQVVNAESRKSMREQLAIEAQLTKGIDRESAKRLSIRRKEHQALAALDREHMREALRGVSQRQAAEKKTADLIVRAQRVATAVTQVESLKRGRSEEELGRVRERVASAWLVSHERAERAATEATRREAQQRIDAIRRERAAERPPPPPGQPAPGGGGGRGGGRGGSAVLGTVSDTAQRVLSTVGEFGDSIREQQRNREQLDLSVARLAAGSIGTPQAAPEIMRAVRSISEQTGMTPEQVLAGASQAQAAFSSLGTAGSRREYLTNVLPTLARASVGTGTSLEDMVSAAGEMQRQANINPEHLGEAVRRSIARGRLGSVEFSDEARHLGAIASATGRFMRTDTAEQSQQSIDVAEALFQTAGQGGGGGDVAATRTRGFLSNLTSAKGRGRLTGLLGHDAFDRSGRLITREGESQSAAFQRMIESAWTASHGNAGRFLTAVGGNNGRSREVADQLMRDLRAHGGHLETFQSLLNPGAADADAAFNAVGNTAAVQRAKQENRTFFRQTDAENAAPYNATDQQMRMLGEKNPALAMFLNNTTGRGAFDVANTVNPGAMSGLFTYSQQTQEAAQREYERRHGWFKGLLAGPGGSEENQIMESLTSGANRNASKVSNAAKDAAGLNGTVDLSQPTMRALARAVAEAIADAHITATVSPVDAAHAASINAAQR